MPIKLDRVAPKADWWRMLAKWTGAVITGVVSTAKMLTMLLLLAAVRMPGVGGHEDRVWWKVPGRFERWKDPRWL